MLVDVAVAQALQKCWVGKSRFGVALHTKASVHGDTRLSRSPVINLAERWKGEGTYYRSSSQCTGSLDWNAMMLQESMGVT